MVTQIGDEYDRSSDTILTAANTFRKKLVIILPQLMSKWNDVTCTNCIPRSIPVVADKSMPNEVGRSIPTEAEVCLLFCSMFPEGFILPIEDLVMYGMALNLFEDVHNMSHARCRVNDLIKIINHRLPPHHLNKLCLWEDKYGDRYVKILDGALDSAKSIASKYQLAICSETVQRMWSSIDLQNYCYGLSLVLRRINQNPDNLKCPKLALLQLQHREDSQSIVVDLFEGIKELLVLSLDVPSLSHSLDVLCNLRMLHLKVLRFENMSCIGGLINLEFLSISTPSLTDIPKEMGQLGNLRLLDLKNMNVAWIPQGVLSRMLKLEELYLPLSFQRWGCKSQDEHDDYDERGSWEEDDYDDRERINASIREINDGERMNASISDIVSPLLNALQIIIPKASILPKKSPIFKNMQRFKILVPNNLKDRSLGKCYSLNVLQLTGDAQDIKESGICDLMSRMEDLNLTRVRKLKNVLFELQDYDFPQLQKMIISECDELEYIVDMKEKQILREDDYLFSKLESVHLSMLSNLKEIWHGRRMKLQLFGNLSQISIRFCHKLKYVFPLSIFKGCSLLKSIAILDCNEMAGIFYQDEENDNPIVPSFIEELDLHSLPKLVDILVDKDVTFDGVLGDTDQSLTTNEKVSLIKNNEEISHMEMYFAFSSKLAEKWLQNLRRLKIAFCDAVKVIFLFEENPITSTPFNSLKKLELYGLRNLMHIWFLVPLEIIAFQNLQLLVLSECQNLYLFSPRVAKLLIRLQKVYVNRCEKIEEIMVKEDDNEVEGKIVFPQLKLLELQHVPNLRTFFNGVYPMELPLLESLKFNQCNKMKSFSYGSLRTPMLKRVEINESSYSLLRDGLNATIERYMGNCFGTPSNDTSSTVRTDSPTPGPSFSVAEANSNNQILRSGGSTICPSGPITNPNGSVISPSGSSNNSYSTTTTMDFSATNTGACRNQFSTAASEANENANPNGEIFEAPNYKKEFTFADLKIATKNFSSDNLLGQGDFGKVYKGWLDEKTFAPSKTGTGTVVAIKKASWEVFQECQLELIFLEMQSHPNLVQLLGYCWEDKELLLVYEFIPRGSLDYHLFTNNAEIEPLSWNMRLKIAIGVAQGLSFLHTSKKVIYRAIKPTNILLDNDYNAKICNFELAKWGPSDGDSQRKTMIAIRKMMDKGDILDSWSDMDSDDGWSDMDPDYSDYVTTGRVQTDVYRFGVVLLQLMTGSSRSDINRRKEELYLVERFKSILPKESRLENIIDSRMEGQCTTKAILLTTELVLRCTEDDPEIRSMREVLKDLQEIVSLKEDRK